MIIATVRDAKKRDVFKNDPSDLEFLSVSDFRPFKAGGVLAANNLMFALTSKQAFKNIQTSMQKKNGKNLLVYVHGFNNDWEQTIKRGLRLEKDYNVNVLVYSWPSDDALKYRDCKRRARIAAEGLDRLFEKLQTLILGLKPAEICHKKITLMCHSMGNYMLKQTLKQSERIRFPFFNNVVLCQADVNNYDHELWVDKIHFNDNLYVTINDKDYALGISALKIGEAQKRRLGRYTKNLTSKNANYINMSDWKGIHASHAPFSSKRIGKCSKAKKLFKIILNGEKY